jgi:hypothetical protein
LKLGEQHAILLTHHDSFVKIVNGVFGDGKDKPPPPPGTAGVKDLAAGHASPEAAAAAINAALGF